MFDAPNSSPPPMILSESVERMKDPEVKKHAFSLIGQLIGWCSDQKASIIIDMILKYKPEKILEIGVFGGKSLMPMAYALQVNGKGVIYGIDPWKNSESLVGVMDDNNRHYWGWVDHDSIMQGLINKMQEFGLEGRIRLIRDTSEHADPIYDIDILHVDGNHSDVTSYIDVTKWVPLMKSGGWIIFDDMSWYENGQFTTARAVDWLNKHCIKFAEFNDTDTWGIWYKP